MHSHPPKQLLDVSKFPQPDFEPKIHKRTDTLRLNQAYTLSYSRTTSSTSETSPTNRTWITYDTLSMNEDLFFLTYNIAPKAKGGLYGSNTKAQLGASASAAGINRHHPTAGEAARLRRQRASVPVPAAQIHSSRRDGANYQAVRYGMDGRAGAARLTFARTTPTAHFDASAGTTSLSFVVPVLLSSGKGEGDVSANAGRDADRATQARQSASQEQQQEQVTKCVSGMRFGGESFVQRVELRGNPRKSRPRFVQPF